MLDSFSPFKLERCFVNRSLVLLLIATLIVGCGPTASTTPTTPAKSNEPPSHNHPTAGPHGGPLVEWGEEELHLEVVIDHKTGSVTVYVLDEEVKKQVPITTDKLTLATSGTPSVTVTLTADPDEGDKATKGASSRFVGKDDALKGDQLISGSVSGVKDGKPYTGKFKEKKPK